MSIHDHVLQVLSAMLDGDVDPELRGLAEDHLQRCSRCQTALDAFTRVDVLAREVLLPSDPAAFEAANLVQLGRAVAELAARREESRGGHWRSDHPAPVEAWRVRQTLTRTASGHLEAGLLAVPAAVEAGR